MGDTMRHRNCLVEFDGDWREAEFHEWGKEIRNDKEQSIAIVVVKATGQTYTVVPTRVRFHDLVDTN